MKIELQDHDGKFWLAEPRDKEAADWMSGAAPKGAMWFGPCLVIEWSTVNSFQRVARAAGIELQHAYFEKRRRSTSPWRH